MKTNHLLAGIALFAIIALNCAKSPDEIVTIKQYPISDLQGVIARTGVEFDPQISSDGNGSLHITTTDSATIKLYETGDLDIENARLIYRAKLKTIELTGPAYLEMWCSFPGKGEFFSRSLDNPLLGTNDWLSAETPFMLQKGENPDNVKLNLVIAGAGEVWIDDIKLIKAPLQ